MADISASPKKDSQEQCSVLPTSYIDATDDQDQQLDYLIEQEVTRISQLSHHEAPDKTENENFQIRLEY